MKKYILRSESRSVHIVTEYRSEITDKLTLLKLEGEDLKDFTVIEIDTERYPPVTKTAKDWLNPTHAAETPTETSVVVSKAEKGFFARALKKVVDLFRNIFLRLLKKLVKD